MPRRYHLTPIIGLLRDEASVKFHIKSDDYFGTIATVLSLLAEQIKKDRLTNAALLKTTLKNLENDLLFLQKNYRIGRRRTVSRGARPKTGRPARTGKATRTAN